MGINIETGKNIRSFRKARKMNLEELAGYIHKSKATLSKYERGEILPDIETLLCIADVLGVHIEQLLHQSEFKPHELTEIRPSFFRGLDRFYSYFYDGRSGKLVQSLFDIFAPSGPNSFKTAMYMNYSDPCHYQKCENTFWGYIEHFDAMSLIELVNQDNPMEKASIQILASFLDADCKWGLWNGVSSRPLMPVATKMLFSKKPLIMDTELIEKLRISKDDIKRMKYYNMFSVV